MGVQINGAQQGNLAFPAVQNASSDANTLDDYEEGTWTMAVAFAGASVGQTASTNTGRYTKKGREVHVSGLLTLTAKGSSTGDATLTGLPFTIANNSGAYSACALRYATVSFANQYMGFGLINTTTITLEELTEAGTRTVLGEGNFADTSTVLISLTYEV